MPDTVTVTLDDVCADPATGLAALSAADRSRRGVALAGAVRFGASPAADVALLRFLSAATSRLTDLHWTLGGAPPWPVRAVVHLLPPRHDGGGTAAEFAGRWREGHRFGLCAYRRGPGFARVRDVRPGGAHRDILIGEPWAALFDALAGDAVTPPDDRSRQLLEELTGAGLAVRLGEFHHLLPFHRRRAPIPASGR